MNNTQVKFISLVIVRLLNFLLSIEYQKFCPAGICYEGEGLLQFYLELCHTVVLINYFIDLFIHSSLGFRNIVNKQ